MSQHSTDTNILEQIQSLIEDNQLSFLIGAGFSKNISRKFPLWKELLADAIWDMYGTGNDSDRPKKEATIEKQTLREHSLLDIASKVVADAGFHESIDDYIEAHTPYLKLDNKQPVLMRDGKLYSNSVTFDCHNLLRQLNIPNIYTFNYDNALEFCLGDKQLLQSKKETLLQEMNEARKKVAEIEELIRNCQEEMVPDSSLDGSVGPVVASGNTANVSIDDRLKDLYQTRNERISALLELERGERALDKEIEQSYLVVKEASDISLTSGGHNIYKIHGDLRIKKDEEADYGFDGDKHTQYIITKEDYDTYEEKHSAFVNLMRIDLLRNRFCVIGVAGGDANFLAWINWVKDVLDKAGHDSVKTKWSYFVYAGKEDMSRTMTRMLRNHFIIPVVLKDFFPKATDETERVKAFLEYIQPNDTLQTERLTQLWKDVDRNSWRDGKSIELSKSGDLDELCNLSSKIVFHKAVSAVHNAAKDVQASAFWYLKDISDASRNKVYAAALRCSMLPAGEDRSTSALVMLRKSKSAYVKETYQHAFRRMRLLADPTHLHESTIGSDEYSRLLKRFFVFDFPAERECVYECKSGLDYIRLYSLQKLLTGHSTVNVDLALRHFASPQETILAADWLRWLGCPLKSPVLIQAKKYKQRYSLFHLHDYFQSYLKEMKKKKDVFTYGNVREIVYMDGWYAGYENAAVILNSLVELGITFNDHTVLSDEDWISVASELKSTFPYPVAFYTISRGSKDCVIKRVAQELMYDSKAYQIIPDLLTRLMRALVSENAPKSLIAPIARFAEELFVAVPITKWGTDFKKVVGTCLELASTKIHLLGAKALYSFVSAGMEYIHDKKLKLKCLEHVFDNLSKKDSLDNELNSLAISASRELTIKDLAPVADRLVAVAEKHRTKRLDSYVLINLAHLLSAENLGQVRGVLEKQALKDSNLPESYAILVSKNAYYASEFKQKLVARKDIWQCGVVNGRASLGDRSIRITRIDNVLHFDKEQVLIIFNDLRTSIEVIRVGFERPNKEVVERGWMSNENVYREAVMDMMIFAHQHVKDLEGLEGYQQALDDLSVAYSYCMYRKTNLQLLADDKTYIAIRSMMTQADIKGIQTLQAEYEALLGKILTRSSKDVNMCLQHVAWAIKEYEDFFNTKDFAVLLQSILDSYAQYFVSENSRAWDVEGCEKEAAEKYLLSIAKTQKGRGYAHPFWDKYDGKYYLN